jgi:hypothetical protein
MLDRQLHAIRDKVENGQRLTFEEGLYLYEHADLFTLGQLANLVRERLHGKYAYYNVNVHLNPTNVCVYRCTFCAFRADLKSPKGYLMSDEEILAARCRGPRSRGDRNAHCRWLASPDALRMVSPHPRADPSPLSRNCTSKLTQPWSGTGFPESLVGPRKIC